MSGRRARQFRKAAERLTVGESAKLTRRVYQRLKRKFKADRRKA